MKTLSRFKIDIDVLNQVHGSESVSHLLGRHIKADCPQVDLLVGVNTGDYEEDPGALRTLIFIS